MESLGQNNRQRRKPHQHPNPLLASFKFGNDMMKLWNIVDSFVCNGFDCNLARVCEVLAIPLLILTSLAAWQNLALMFIQTPSQCLCDPFESGVLKLANSY